MSHWPFIAAAYGFAITGTAVIVLLSFLRMRRAEQRADALARRD